jgi:hypothetical protein
MFLGIKSLLSEFVHDVRETCSSSKKLTTDQSQARAVSVVCRVAAAATTAIAGTSLGLLTFSETVHNNGAYIAATSALAVTATVLSHDLLVLAKNIRNSFGKGMPGVVNTAIIQAKEFLHIHNRKREERIMCKGTWLCGKCCCKTK